MDMENLILGPEDPEPDRRPESFKKWTEGQTEAKNQPVENKPGKRYKRKGSRSPDKKPRAVYSKEEVARLEELTEQAKTRTEARAAQQKALAAKVGLDSDTIPRSWVEGGYKLDLPMMEIFCTEFSKHSRISVAAKAVGVHVSTVRNMIKSNPLFAAMVDEAKEVYKDRILEAVYERAVNGIDEPIIGGVNRDSIVAYKKIYSDRLLELEAKRVEPSYRDKAGVEINTGKGVLVVQGSGMSEADWSEKYGTKEINTE